MQLRDIALHVRHGEAGEKIWWKNAFLRFANRKSILIEKWVAHDHPTEHPWNLFVNERSVGDFSIDYVENQRIDHKEMDEFTAQGVLDHYIQVYGLPEEVRPK